MQMRRHISGFLCLGLLAVEALRTPTMQASGLHKMPVYRPGHLLNEAANDYFYKGYGALVKKIFDQGEGVSAAEDARNRADAYWWKRAWSQAAECEQLSAMHLVLSNPDTKLYYSAYSPVEERKTASYYYSHESGAGFRVASQLRVDTEGKPTDDPRGRLLSVLTFWDFDFATGTLVALSGLDSLRMRTASWQQRKDNAALGVSYTTMRDAAGGLTRIEAGQYSDLANRDLTASIESPAQIDNCSGCHFSVESNVDKHEFGATLTAHAGYQVFREYMLGGDIGRLLELAHDADDGVLTNIRARRTKRHTHKSVRLVSAKHQSAASKAAAMQIAEDMKNPQTAKNLFKQSGAVDAIEARWHELTNIKQVCLEPVHDEGAAKRLLAKVKADALSEENMRAHLELFLADELSYIRDKSGKYVGGSLRGDVRQIVSELNATNQRSGGKLDVISMQLEDFSADLMFKQAFRATIHIDAKFKGESFDLSIPVTGSFDGAAYTIAPLAPVATVLPEALKVAPPVAFATEGLLPTTASMQDKLFDPLCVGCHSGQNPPGGLDLSDVKSLLSKTHDDTDDDTAKDARKHENFAYIEPGRPQDSLIYRHIVSQDVQDAMPPRSTGFFLDARTKNLVAIWIENLAFDLSEQGPRPGRYLGYALMRGQALKIPLLSDLVLVDNNNYSHYRSILRLNQGSHGSDVYQTQYFDTVAYSMQRDELHFSNAIDKNRGDLSLQKVEIYRDGNNIINLKGELKSTAGAALGQAHLRWQPEDHNDASDVADIFEDKKVFPNLTGRYEGRCDRDEIILDLLMSRVGYRNDLQNRIAMDRIFPDYALSGQFYYKNNHELRNWLTGSETNMFKSRVKLFSTSETYDCKVTDQGLSCNKGSCELRRKVSAEVGRDAGTENVPRRRASPEETAVYQRFPKTWQAAVADEDPTLLERNPEKLEGLYCGYLHHEALNTYQRICNDVDAIGSEEFFTHNTEKQDIAVTSTAYFGLSPAADDNVTYQFDRRTYLSNVFPYFSLEGVGDTLHQIRSWTSTVMTGVYFAKSFGRVGTFSLVKGSEPIPPPGVYVMPAISRCLKSSNEHWLDIDTLRAGPLDDHLRGPFHWSLRGRESFYVGGERSYTNQVNDGQYDSYTNTLALVMEGAQASGNAAEFVMHGHVYQNEMHLFRMPQPVLSAKLPKLGYSAFKDYAAKEEPCRP